MNKYILAMIVAVFAMISLQTSSIAATNSAFALHENQIVGGTKKNPAVETTFAFNGGKKVAVNKMGRGRKGIVTIEATGSDLVVTNRLENHHRSRGWTLTNTVSVYNAEGVLIASDSYTRGLKPKLYGSYKRAQDVFRFVGVAADAAYIQVVTSRTSSKRFLGEAAKNIIKFVKVVKAVRSGGSGRIANRIVQFVR